VKKRFQSLPFKCSLQRYIAGADLKARLEAERNTMAEKAEQLTQSAGAFRSIVDAL
jgi:hypothetical protein